MNDPIIRAALREKFESHATMLVDEFSIARGYVRADLAILTESFFVGIEIKSIRDTLARLPRQIEQYDEAFDQCLLVVEGEKHLAKLGSMLPAHWGLWQAYEEDGVCKFKVIKAPEMNTTNKAGVLTHMLWREEAYEVAKELGVGVGMSSASRGKLIKAVNEVVRRDKAKARKIVLTAMKSRELGRWAQINS